MNNKGFKEKTNLACEAKAQPPHLEWGQTCKQQVEVVEDALERVLRDGS